MLAQRLNCQAGGGDGCANCQGIVVGSWPDLLMVAADGKSLGIERVKELQQRLSNRPMTPDVVRVVIIEADDSITEPAQNRLLKTLEEPPPQTLILMVVSDLD